MCKLGGRDHNATSYSTETNKPVRNKEKESLAEIITLRAIALKRNRGAEDLLSGTYRRDHNATSYSTETMRLEELSAATAWQRS